MQFFTLLNSAVEKTSYREVHENCSTKPCFHKGIPEDIRVMERSIIEQYDKSSELGNELMDVDSAVVNFFKQTGLAFTREAMSETLE